MGRCELFEHTADLGLRVRAVDLNDLFRSAAEGLFDVVVANRDDVLPRARQHVALSADSPETLLVDWLNELIYLGETSHHFFGRFDVRVGPDGRSLDAEIHGEPLDPDRHVVDHEVKAVTRHGLRLVKEKEGWLAELILDI
jgi:SHS2 domain-containing protein